MQERLLDVIERPLLKLTCSLYRLLLLLQTLRLGRFVRCTLRSSINPFLAGRALILTKPSLLATGLAGAHALPP